MIRTAARQHAPQHAATSGWHHGCVVDARSRADRPYDVVLFGATGFTGGLTAERLAADGPDGMRWAIAGRDAIRLDAVRGRLSGISEVGATVATLRADVTDATSIRNLAEQTSVIATTVGPYREYGEPLVAACAAAGTDYADLSGEPEFVDRTWLAQHDRALETGARLVHACGFDSLPHDLGAYVTVLQLPADVPITVAGYVRAGGNISAGTYHSAVRALSRVRQSTAASARRRAAETRPTARRVAALPQRPMRSPDGRGYALPLPTIDPVIVRRSARALERYGPDFRYGHYAVVRSLPTLLAASAVLTGMLAVAQLPPGRDLLLRLRSAGEGPSREQRDKSWFKVAFFGEGGGCRVRTEVSGGDPGYDETAMMLSQSALCLAFDELPETAGQVTTVQAMGDALLTRVQAHGMCFEVTVE